MDRWSVSPRRDNSADHSVIDYLARRVFARGTKTARRAFTEAHGRALEHAIARHRERTARGLPEF